MGCLNSEGKFEHWFGNIHLSGNCNRSCYFCIGQYMMSLDKYNVHDKFPLDGLDEFVKQCKAKGITEVNITGTNTDPMLYKHTQKLKDYLLQHIPNLFFKIRTNAVSSNYDLLKLYDGGSITICSFDKDIYRKMMGQGAPPNLDKLLDHVSHWTDLKINIVLGIENVENGDVLKTIEKLVSYGIPKINLREPYGQPHVGNPISSLQSTLTIFGNPTYIIENTSITYWDVHYTEVESINLYANGIVSDTYPITKGHDPENGIVVDQSQWTQGRHYEQWLNKF